MRANRFLKRSAMKQDMELQITSMADIFTILLVFLLKSFSTSVTSISPSNEITLPSAKGGDEMVDVLKIEITPTVITLDDKPVTQLQSFRFEQSDIEVNRTSRSLNQSLIKEKKRREQARAISSVADPSDGSTDTRKLMVLADEKTPYAILKSVLTSAANVGFIDFKLVVIEDQ